MTRPPPTGGRTIIAARRRTTSPQGAHSSIPGHERPRADAFTSPSTIVLAGGNDLHETARLIRRVPLATPMNAPARSTSTMRLSQKCSQMSGKT